MIKPETLYQAILQKLNEIPSHYLWEINHYLEQLRQKADKKQDNIDKILSFAGSWADMSDEDFEDYLHEAKRSGQEAFGKEVNL